MLEKTGPSRISNALDEAPNGILTLEILRDLRWMDEDTLKTTLCRMGKNGQLLRLKRGVYSTNPPRDLFACAQALFGGYLAFSTALYLHKLTTEIPFTLYVATPDNSAKKQIGENIVRAVARKEKATGTIRREEYVISSQAKTLFDCLDLPEYGVEESKLIDAYADAEMGKTEWAEFDSYVRRFADGRRAEHMRAVKKQIMEKVKKQIAKREHSRE